MARRLAWLRRSRTVSRSAPPASIRDALVAEVVDPDVVGDAGVGECWVPDLGAEPVSGEVAVGVACASLAGSVFSVCAAVSAVFGVGVAAGGASASAVVARPAAVPVLDVGCRWRGAQDGGRCLALGMGVGGRGAAGYAWRAGRSECG